ncbi:MAG: hypothetical protein KF764_10535 [Labilithrix sp.]|nr:hypothetical protein [Labilithrix sp.]
MPDRPEVNTHHPVRVQPNDDGARHETAPDDASHHARPSSSHDAHGGTLGGPACALRPAGPPGDADTCTPVTPPALGAELRAVLEQLGPVELRVVRFVAERLLAGQEVYGPLRIATDARDWRRERDEELADAVVYSACESLRRDLGGGR